MNESQWASAKTISYQLDPPFNQNRRKLRLLATACVRRMIRALPPDPAFLAIIEAAEQYADDRDARPAALSARKAVRTALKRLKDTDNPELSTQAGSILIDLTNDVLEGHTAGIANSIWVMSHRNAVEPSNALKEKNLQADYLRDIFGNPFRPTVFDPAWQTNNAVALARTMYDARDFSAMPILADALQDAGCENATILQHCRNQSQVHVRGCWVVDSVLGNG